MPGPASPALPTASLRRWNLRASLAPRIPKTHRPQMNPAVSLGLALVGALSPMQAVANIIAQAGRGRAVGGRQPPASLPWPACLAGSHPALAAPPLRQPPTLLPTDAADLRRHPGLLLPLWHHPQRRQLPPGLQRHRCGEPACRRAAAALAPEQPACCRSAHARTTLLPCPGPARSLASPLPPPALHRALQRPAWARATLSWASAS